MNAEVEKIHQLAERWTAEDVLRWAFATFQQHVEIASGFGVEGVVLIDIAARLQPGLRVFTLDTDFLFPETYALMEGIEKRYGITVERLRSALTPEEQEQQYGAALWSRSPDVCCNLRKVEPLRNKLSQLSAWITSIRRDQTSFRAAARKVEWDERFHLVKINPLADWTSERIWRYVREHNVLYNPLHDQDYPSIGCTHCTRRVLPGEDPRAGRWSGFNKTECGLHGPAQVNHVVTEIKAARLEE
ncbi:MAG: phosphoadenylyl-sulfate reductase [Acidobacteriia bacterium]|nr:phosphoadenylyl-sulfate reductase [Terriglobia bacterium]